MQFYFVGPPHNYGTPCTIGIQMSRAPSCLWLFRKKVADCLEFSRRRGNVLPAASLLPAKASEEGSGKIQGFCKSQTPTHRSTGLFLCWLLLLSVISSSVSWQCSGAGQKREGRGKDQSLVLSVVGGSEWKSCGRESPTMVRQEIGDRDWER
jgi:hypothetical protein